MTFLKALGDLPLAQHIAKVFAFYVWEAGDRQYFIDLKNKSQ